MAAGNPNYRLWLQSVLGWDGLLPVLNVLIPRATRLLIPNIEALFAGIAVGLPIVSLIVRAKIGKGTIKANHCGPAIRVFQYCAFGVGILLLFIIDAFVITVTVMAPQGLAALSGSEWSIVGWQLSIYLLLMAVAMYPGRGPTPASNLSPSEID